MCELQMQADIEAVYEAHRADFSGVCLVQRGAETIFSAVDGLANRDFSVPNTMNTKFDTASITKVFTAVAVLMLVEQSQLRLSNRIHDLVDLHDTMIHPDVTVEQLLTHTSGIADDADEEAGEDYAALFVHKPNYAIRECEDFLPNFAYKPGVFAPGTDVRYNNCAFVLLGLMIERLSGMSYREFVTEYVFKAAGMHDTCFRAMDELCPNAAEGYFAVRDERGAVVKWKKNIYSYPPIGTADGGALTTAADLSRFVQALVGGELLSHEHNEAILAPHCAFERPHHHGTRHIGYALEFIEVDGKLVCMYKEGSNAGVDAIMAYYPALDLTEVMLSNQEGPLWAMHRGMQASIIGTCR